MACALDQEDRGTLIAFLHLANSFPLAPTAGDEQMAGQKLPDNSSNPPPPEIPKTELERRAGIKFSGATGAVVASGSEAATTAPTYGLIDDVIETVKGLPPALFDHFAEHRPYGLLLDKYVQVRSVRQPHLQRERAAAGAMGE